MTREKTMAEDAGPLLGAHMSIAGGPYRACELGRSIGCDAIQIFTKAPSQWAARPLTKEDGALFKQARRQQGIRAVVAHNSYLVNLGSPKDDLWEKSIAAMAGEMERCRLLGVSSIVAHPGAHQGKGVKWGVRRIAEGLDRVFDSLPKANRVKVLLETTAGMGTSVGHTFEELAAVRKASRRPRRIGYCLDTAHILAAGYEYRTKEAYEETMHRFDRICGLSRLEAVHLNDSKKDLGARVDRHDRVGKGFAGKEALARFAADPRFLGVPVVLEVPGGMEAFRKDLMLLRRLARRERGKTT